jgi:hypothetical protein
MMLYGENDYPATELLQKLLDTKGDKISVRIYNCVKAVIDIRNGLGSIGYQKGDRYTQKYWPMRDGMETCSYHCLETKKDAELYSAAFKLILLNKNHVTPDEVSRLLEK